MDGIEKILDGDVILSMIICNTATPTETTFVTPNEFYQQAGFVVYPVGGKIVNHTHKPIERHLIGPPKTLFVHIGKLEVRFFKRKPVGSDARGCTKYAKMSAVFAKEYYALYGGLYQDKNYRAKLLPDGEDGQIRRVPSGCLNAAHHHDEVTWNVLGMGCKP